MLRLQFRRYSVYILYRCSSYFPKPESLILPKEFIIHLMAARKFSNSWNSQNYKRFKQSKILTCYTLQKFVLVLADKKGRTVKRLDAHKLRKLLSTIKYL